MRTIWIAAYVHTATNEIDEILTYSHDRNNAIYEAIAWFSKQKEEAWDIDTRLAATAAMGNLMDMVTNNTKEFPLKDSGYMVAIMEMKEA